MKAEEAQKKGLFAEIIPTTADRFVEKADGTIVCENFIKDFDDGVRDTTTIEGLAKLRTVFAANGSVTAGNADSDIDPAQLIHHIRHPFFCQLPLG